MKILYSVSPTVPPRQVPETRPVAKYKGWYWLALNPCLKHLKSLENSYLLQSSLFYELAWELWLNLLEIYTVPRKDNVSFDNLLMKLGVDFSETLRTLCDLTV